MIEQCAWDDDDDQRQDFAGGKDVLDPRHRLDIVAVDGRQQACKMKCHKIGNFKLPANW